MDNTAVERAKEHFGKIVEEQLNRVEEMKKAIDWIDYTVSKGNHFLSKIRKTMGEIYKIKRRIC